jgi:hypothetical protein
MNVWSAQDMNVSLHVQVETRLRIPIHDSARSRENLENLEVKY